MKPVADTSYTDNKTYFQFIHLYEAYGLVGCKTVRFGESPTLRRNISTPSSRSRSKPSKKPAEVREVLLVFSTCFSETSVSPRTARHNPSESSLQSLLQKRRIQQTSLFQCTLPRFYWVQCRAWMVVPDPKKITWVFRDRVLRRISRRKKQ
jgi:hypothetical protein